MISLIPRPATYRYRYCSSTRIANKENKVFVCSKFSFYYFLNHCKSLFLNINWKSTPKTSAAPLVSVQNIHQTHKSRSLFPEEQKGSPIGTTGFNHYWLILWQNKSGIILSCSRVSTTVWSHDLEFNETVGGKARWELWRLEKREKKKKEKSNSVAVPRNLWQETKSRRTGTKKKQKHSHSAMTIWTGKN